VGFWKIVLDPSAWEVSLNDRQVETSQLPQRAVGLYGVSESVHTVSTEPRTFRRSSGPFQTHFCPSYSEFEPQHLVIVHTTLPPDSDYLLRRTSVNQCTTYSREGAQRNSTTGLDLRNRLVNSDGIGLRIGNSSKSTYTSRVRITIRLLTRVLRTLKPGADTLGFVLEGGHCDLCTWSHCPLHRFACDSR